VVTNHHHPSQAIEAADTDMLLPGSVVKFSVFDWFLIWAPVLFGLISAIIKAARGSLNFSTLQNTLSSVLLVILPVTWAVRAYLAVADKQRVYTAHLNKVVLLVRWYARNQCKGLRRDNRSEPFALWNQ